MSIRFLATQQHEDCTGRRPVRYIDRQLETGNKAGHVEGATARSRRGEENRGEERTRDSAACGQLQVAAQDEGARILLES